MKKQTLIVAIKSILISSAIMALASCKKFVDIPAPNHALTGSAVFSSDVTAVATMNGLYVRMSDETTLQGGLGISVLTGLASDELTLSSRYVLRKLNPYFQNNLSSLLDTYSWNKYYNYLQTINSILEGLENTNKVSEQVKTQLKAEAKFLRAFFNFYLVNLYGDVPLVLTSDWRTNSTVSRTPKEQVWLQIIKDLIEAQNELSDKFLMGDAKTPYVTSSEERVRPTKWAATALLARAYLYTKDWANAEIQSTILINSQTNFEILSDVNKVFLKDSREAIWQIKSVNPSFSTLEAPAFILLSSGPGNFSPVYLSSFLMNAFEPNDIRRKGKNWIDSVKVSGTTYFFPYKYKVRSLAANTTPTEYFTIFRLGEQYLIRAEARAHQNKVDESKSDLNIIRNRAGLPSTNAIDQNTLLNAIGKERQVELFTEIGHRWFDLKRTAKIDEVMTTVTPLKANGAQWQPYKQYWPIYFRDMQLNPNMSQTAGY